MGHVGEINKFSLEANWTTVTKPGFKLQLFKQLIHLDIVITISRSEFQEYDRFPGGTGKFSLQVFSMHGLS